jgi:hypothetical protein
MTVQKQYASPGSVELKCSTLLIPTPSNRYAPDSFPFPILTINFYSPIFFSVFHAVVFHKVLLSSVGMINHTVVLRIRLGGCYH